MVLQPQALECLQLVVLELPLVPDLQTETRFFPEVVGLHLKALHNHSLLLRLHSFIAFTKQTQQPDYFYFECYDLIDFLLRHLLVELGGEFFNQLH